MECPTMNTYIAPYSPHISKETLGCVECGSPHGGVDRTTNTFYCWQHMPKEAVITGKGVFLY